VQDQITAGLKLYRDWQDPGKEQLVALQVRGSSSSSSSSDSSVGRPILLAIV
jgi:hypothetical protein